MPVKSTVAARRARSKVNPHPDPASDVHREVELAVPHHVDHPPHLLLGVVLHVLHVGVHHVEAELVDHPAHLLDPLRAGRDLGLEVGDVLVRIAGRPPSRPEVGAQIRLQEPAPRPRA